MVYHHAMVRCASWLLVVWWAPLGCIPASPPDSGSNGVPPAGSPSNGAARASTNGPKRAPARDQGKCGDLSYGIHRRLGDRIGDIEARRAGQLPCAIPCDPKPPFATGRLGRNEHGGYGFLDITPEHCQFKGMDLPIAKCHATCEKQDRLGSLSIELTLHDEGARATLCRAFEQRRGPPDVGSCECLKDDIEWLPSKTEAAAVLHFLGTYSLDCGFPPANYLPSLPPE